MALNLALSPIYLLFFCGILVRLRPIGFVFRLVIAMSTVLVIATILTFCQRLEPLIAGWITISIVGGMLIISLVFIYPFIAKYQPYIVGFQPTQDPKATELFLSSGRAVSHQNEQSTYLHTYRRQYILLIGCLIILNIILGYLLRLLWSGQSASFLMIYIGAGLFLGWLTNRLIFTFFLLPRKIYLGWKEVFRFAICLSISLLIGSVSGTIIKGNDLLFFTLCDVGMSLGAILGIFAWQGMVQSRKNMKL